MYKKNFRKYHHIKREKSLLGKSRLPSTNYNKLPRLPYGNLNKANFSSTTNKKAIVGTSPTATAATLALAGPLAGTIIGIYTMAIFLAEGSFNNIMRETITVINIFRSAVMHVLTEVAENTMAQVYTYEQLRAFLDIIESIINMIPDVKNRIFAVLHHSAALTTSNIENLNHLIEILVDLEKTARSCYRVLEGELGILIQESNIAPLQYEDVYSQYLDYLSSVNLI